MIRVIRADFDLSTPNEVYSHTFLIYLLSWCYSKKFWGLLSEIIGSQNFLLEFFFFGTSDSMEILMS